MQGRGTTECHQDLLNEWFLDVCYNLLRVRLKATSVFGIFTTGSVMCEFLLDCFNSVWGILLDSGFLENVKNRPVNSRTTIVLYYKKKTTKKKLLLRWCDPELKSTETTFANNIAVVLYFNCEWNIFSFEQFLTLFFQSNINFRKLQFTITVVGNVSHIKLASL